ncbi:MAG: hypothetical protein JXB47_20885 [Anaerolineae bacterium]|nr:hypothetical protein [Anaerolineae bacterium]
MAKRKPKFKVGQLVQVTVKRVPWLLPGEPYRAPLFVAGDRAYVCEIGLHGHRCRIESDSRQAWVDEDDLVKAAPQMALPMEVDHE